jgi:hypothetical protein
MFKTVSGLSFIAVAVLALLQMIPVVSFLLVFAGGTLLGLLINFMLVSIFIEAVVGRIPRALLAIPLVAFGSYYLAYAYQTIDIQRETAALHATNPGGKVFDFDPNVHGLISPDAEALASFYKIPVAYVAEPRITPEKYLSYRLIGRDQCNLQRDINSRIIAGRILFENVQLESVCLLRFPELPPDNAVTVVRHGFDDIRKQDWRITEQITELRRGDAVIGSFKTASVWRLPAFPLLRIACFPRPGNPTWSCGIDFEPTQMFIDAIPAKVDRGQFDTPESIMLGIARRTAADFEDFRGYGQNDTALARVAQEPKRVEDETLAVLKSILDGGDPQQPLKTVSYSITQIPERLAPLAEAMAKRFTELSRLRTEADRGLPDQYLVLASALAALPPEAFGKVSDAVFDAIQNENQALDAFGPLYLRMAGSGTKTLAFYEREFTSGRFAGSTRVYPVLAICRIGQASPEIVSEMKRQFAIADNSWSESEYKAALLVTLVKLGEQSFVEANRQVMHAKHRAWTDSVLAGKGMTETGPNNCMGQRWAGDYLIPSMQPSLR